MRRRRDVGCLARWGQPWCLPRDPGRAMAQTQPAAGSENVLKIGVLGVLRGPAASWGLVNKHCAEVTAQMYNEQGGVKIGNERYKIELTVIDDQLDPKLAISGAEQMLGQGIRYIIGPNIDTTAAVIVPLLRTHSAVNIAYGFARYLYTPPQRNSILGMVASYQSDQIIYAYLKANKGVRSVSFIARNEVDSLNQRDEGVRVAQGVGLVVISSSVTYPSGTTNFRPYLTQMLHGPNVEALAGIRGQTFLGGAQPVGGTPDLVGTVGCGARRCAARAARASPARLQGPGQYPGPRRTRAPSLRRAPPRKGSSRSAAQARPTAAARIWKISLAATWSLPANGTMRREPRSTRSR